MWAESVWLSQMVVCVKYVYRKSGVQMALMAALWAMPVDAADEVAGFARLQVLFADGVYSDVIRRAGLIDPTTPGDELLARRELVARSELMSGRYEEAGRETAALVGALPTHAGAWALRGEVLLCLGRYDDAREAVKEALGLDPKHVPSQLVRLRLARATGRHPTARAAEDFFFGLYREVKELSAAELTAIGEAAGREDPHGAWKAFQEAHTQDPLYVPAYIRAGFHCLEFFAWDKARSEFEKALGIWPLCPDARAGYGALAVAKGEYEEAAERLAGALEVNCRHELALQQQAILYGIGGDYAEGLQVVDSALGTQPQRLLLLAVQASLLDGLGRDAERDGALERLTQANPRPAAAYALLARARARRRSFPDAVAWGRKAIAADPRHWEGYYEAGINLLRLGEEQEGRSLLDRSFRLNPFNLWAYNTLNVVDRDLIRREYVHRETPHFRVKLHRRDDPILWPYLEMLLEPTYERLSKKYGVVPRGPSECDGRLLVLVLQTYEGFSSRTAGLPGLGALGACFGQVITMPTPRLGRVFETHRGNWQRVLVHELTHVMTLQRSKYRVPTWLTEGLSQREEGTITYAGDALLARAWNEGKLPGFGDLERGFTRPQFPGQIALSYQQALLAVELLEREHGEGVFSQLLDSFAAGRCEADALLEATGKAPAELNRQYVEWLSKHAEGVPYLVQAGIGDADVDAALPVTPRDWLARAAAQLKRKEYEDALVSADAAIALDPDLVDAHIARGIAVCEGRHDYDLAEECFERAKELDESCFMARLHLGMLGQKSGRNEMAIRELEAARRLYPRYHVNEVSPYTHLVDLYVETGDRQRAVEVMRDLRAMDPSDREAARGYARLVRRSGASAKDVAQAFHEAIWTDLFDVDVHLDAGDAWETAGDLRAAWREFCAATTIRSRSLDGWLGRARVAGAQGRKDAALEALGRAAQLGADEADIRRLREQFAQAVE